MIGNDIEPAEQPNVQSMRGAGRSTLPPVPSTPPPPKPLRARAIVVSHDLGQQPRQESSPTPATEFTNANSLRQLFVRLLWARRWRYGAAVGGLLLLIIAIAPLFTNRPDSVEAKTAAKTDTPAAAAKPKEPQAAADAASVEPAPKYTSDAPQPSNSGVENTLPSKPAPEPAKPAPMTSAVTEPTAPVATNAAVHDPWAQFHLHGIIYTPKAPKAIMDGRTVEMGDRVDEALVVKIGPTNVILELNGQRKTFWLK